MGAGFVATLADPGGALGPGDVAALRAALVARLERVEDEMSNWRPGSAVNRLSDARPGAWVGLPADLLAVLAAALAVGRATAGAFDAGLGELVSAWGFGPPARRPDPAAIKALTARPRAPLHAVLEIEPAAGRARLHEPRRIDLSGIAKGFGVDAMAGVLSAAGIADHLVGIDGEMRGQGGPGAGPWQVAIEAPEGDAVLGVCGLGAGALATSGSTRNRLRVGAVFVSHSFDGRSARPVQNGVVQASVAAPDCMTADAWASAVMILGPEAAAPLLRARNLDALALVETPAGRAQARIGRFAG